MKTVSLSRRHSVSKFESGMCASGKMMKIWKLRLVDNCPRCNAVGESTTHILQCTSQSARTLWNKSIEDLTNWLVENHSCPDIARLLLQIIDQWRRGEVVTMIKDFEFDGIQSIFDKQALIGWRPIMGGCLSEEWVKVQGMYLKWSGSRKSPRRWAAALIKKLWGIAWDQWEDRNGAIHNTPLGIEMSGGLSLIRAIKAEFSLGKLGLPRKVQSTFPNNVNILLDAPLEDQQCWFVLIRAAREMRNDYRIRDEFSDPKSSLRKWVGL